MACYQRGFLAVPTIGVVPTTVPVAISGYTFRVPR